MTNSFSKWAMSSACRTMPRGLASTRPSLALLVALAQHQQHAQRGAVDVIDIHQVDHQIRDAFEP
jgi:hypothetical protein